MANNITLNTGAGGSELAADDAGSVYYQRVKLTDGTEDSTTYIHSGNGVAANALRVTLASDGTGTITLSTPTSGGTTLYKNIDADESEDEVKGTAGQVYWITAINLATTVSYLKLYNATAASVTVGTTVPDLTFPIPTQGDSNGAGFVLSIPNGIEFDTAITIAATTGVADADSGAPGANEVIVNMGYA